MANNIDSIKKIDKSLDSLVSKLEEVNNRIIKISESSRQLSGLLNGVKTPKGLGDELIKEKENLTLIKALIKEREATERKLTSTIAKKVLIQDDATKKLAKENEELKILRREQRNQVKAVSEVAGAYDKLSAQTNILIKRQQNLQVRQAKGEKLTEREIRRIERLGKAINKNQAILKKTDASVGRFQRNVGNYASGFDGLGNSINQLTREAPAFANSLQTGFLAISNNLPILFDQIELLIDKNRALRVEGKPTQSVFNQLSKSIFSFQTLLSVGVTLLTIYGKQIFEITKKAIQGGAKVRDLIKQQKILNEAYREGAKSASLEISQLQLLLAVASDKTKSDKTRKKAVDKLISSSGGLVKEQDRLNILNGEAVKIENKLIKSILNKAIIQQLQSKIAEDINKLLDNQIKIQREQEIAATKLNTAEFRALQFGEQRKELLDALTKEERKRVEVAKQLQAEGKKIVLSNRDVENTEKSVAKTKKDNEVVQKNINNLIKEALKFTNDYTLELDSNTKSINKRNKAVALSIELAKEREQELKIATESLKALKDLFKDDDSFALPEIDIEATQQKVEEFTKAVSDDLIKAFDKELLQESLGELAGTIEQFTGANGQVFVNFFEQITKGGVKSFESIADVATASFDVIGEVVNAFYQSKIQQYETDLEANNEYYSELLNNDQLTEDERKRLELDREAREKEILDKKKKEQKKQAQINKALAVADILVSTAQGIASAASKVVTLPLIPLIASIGAAQLGIALATPIPQFKDGHLSGTHEGLAVVNDAYGSNYQEIIERKDGTLEMYSDRNQLIHMGKGDKVHKAGTHDAEDYLKGISDNDLIKDVNRHAMLATLQNQNYLIHKLDNKKVIDGNKLNADRIIKAINSKKTKFNLNQNIDLGRDINFANRLNNTL
jgi:hypothetical protein